MTEFRFTDSTPDLVGLMPRLTRMQKLYLAMRQSDQYHHDKDAALALGLHPGTVYNWRHNHPAFRQAEQALGRIWVETAQLVALASLRPPGIHENKGKLPEPNRIQLTEGGGLHGVQET